MMKEDNHVREPIVWIKGSEGNAICTTHAMGCDSDPYFRPAHEVILIGSKGRWFHRGGTGRRGTIAMPFADETKDVWFIPPVSTALHPATFPIDIPSRLIKLFTHSKDAVVLDPFLGSGTTCYCAKKLNRYSIGIEISEKYCEIAAKRCSQEVMEFGV
jgi:site-specific DNA-methyltransferase (adenine-specific)